jgi:Glycosyltransferase family 10 (fucosyltransferase) C-term
VLYYVAPNWHDGAINGEQHCPEVDRCDWTQSGNVGSLKDKFYSVYSSVGNSSSSTIITVAVFHIHSLWEKLHSRYPLNCDWRTNLTLACSEESGVRYRHMFSAGFPNFDGNSTYHPQSSVQRVNKVAFIREDELSRTVHNFSYLIKGGSYVAKDCHKKGGDLANADRDGVVHRIRQAGFRVDGLSKCMRSHNAEGVVLHNVYDTMQNLRLKREAIGRFMFNMAFENSIEDGYVTEKPFDPLIAGTVPVYLGDAGHLKTLLPHPKAAIFVADFKGNYTALAEYLTYLTKNETAYEEHRAWRKNFTYVGNVKNKPLLQRSWHCNVCLWAAQQMEERERKGGVVSTSNGGANGMTRDHCESMEKMKAFCSHLDFFQGKAARGGGAEVFYVSNGTLRSFPNGGTFEAMGLDFNTVVSLSEAEMARCPKGPPMPDLTKKL